MTVLIVFKYFLELDIFNMVSLKAKKPNVLLFILSSYIAYSMCSYPFLSVSVCVCV